jgi:hypothetical protein
MDPRSAKRSFESEDRSLAWTSGVSHLHPEPESQKHRRADCRKGRHDYGGPQSIGAGLLRSVCSLCAAVTIDLTDADELTTPVVSPQSNIIAMTARHSESL